jgi:hypothetical protein
VTGKTDLYQLAIHDQPGLPEIAPSDRDRFSFIEYRRTRKNGIGEGLPPTCPSAYSCRVKLRPSRAWLPACVLPRQESFASLAHTNPTRQRGL